MKIKKHILTLSLILATVVGYGQTFNYSLNYGSIKFGNSPTGQHQFNGLANFVNGITIPLRAESDSSANAASTQWVKRLVQGLGSPLTFSNGLTKTGNDVSLGGSIDNRLDFYTSRASFGLGNNNGLYNEIKNETLSNNFSYGVSNYNRAANSYSQSIFDVVTPNGRLVLDLYSITGIKITDDIFKKGPKLDKDYSKTFVLADSNYLVPKAYVDRQIASLPSSPVTSVNGRTGAVTGLAEESSLATKQDLVTLTTSGTSGSATFNQSTGALNIPNYATGGGGDVTTNTDQTITGKKRMTQPTLLQPLITGAPNAVGDGVTDDAPALQDAIYFAGDNKRVLVLPAGTFLLKSQLNLNTNNLTIRGAGIGKTILKVASDYSGTGAPIITYGKATNLTIEDLEITGNSKMVEAAIRLNSYDSPSTQSTNVFINRVSIHDFWGIGILLGSTSESPDTHSIDELTISNCHIYNIGNPAQPITYTDSDLKYDAINLNGTTKRSMIINNYIHNVAGDGIFSWGRVQSTPNNDYGNMLVEGNQIEMCWMSIEVNGNYLGKGLRINNNLFRYATRNGGYLISIDSDHASVTNNTLYGVDRALIEFTGIGGIIANNTGQIVPWSSTTGGVSPTALVGVCNFVEAYGFENTIENNIFTYPVGRTGSGTYSPVELRGIKLISRTTDPTYQASSYDGVTDLSAYWNIKLNTISGFTHRAIDVTNEKMRKVVLQSNTFRSRNAVETVIPIYGYDWTIEECIFDMTGSTPNANNGVVEVFSPQTDNSNSLFTNNTVINDAWKILNPNGYFVSYYNRFKTTSGTNYIVDEYPIITQAQRLALTPVSGMAVKQSDGIVGTYEYIGTQWVNKGVDDEPLKPSVRIATTANITLSGLLTIDGVTLVAGDRVLVKNQTTASQNGIYIAASGAWSRSADSDSATELNGSTVIVTAGTINSGSLYNQTSSVVTVGTTAVNYLQSFKAGTNISTSGNTISLTANPSIGSATATTQTAGTNNTTVSTTAFTQNAISGKANLSGGNEFIGNQGITGQLSLKPATGVYPYAPLTNSEVGITYGSDSKISIDGNIGSFRFARNGFSGTIPNPLLTSDRTWTLPNKTGTFLLDVDVASGQSIGANTTGNAATSTTSNSTITWGGNTANFSQAATATDALMGFENGVAKFILPSVAKNFLATTLNDVALMGNTSSVVLRSSAANDGNANTFVKNTDLSNYALKTPVFSTAGTSATLLSSGRYIPQNSSLTIYTLPTTAAVGDVIFINGKGAGGWRISQNTGQVIHGATDTTTGSAGYVGSTARYNSIAIVCVTANTEWIIQSSQGSLTIN